MTNHDIQGIELAASILTLIDLPALSAEVEWALTATPEELHGTDIASPEARIRVRNVRAMVEAARAFVDATRTWGVHARETLPTL